MSLIFDFEQKPARGKTGEKAGKWVYADSPENNGIAGRIF
jgi:hypothetical protein